MSDHITFYCIQKGSDVALRVSPDAHAQDSLWVFYLHRAEAHDRELIDTWKDDLSITIIFVRGWLSFWLYIY